MKIIIEGMLMSIYRSNTFKDKETGQETQGKQKLNIVISHSLDDGSIKHEIQDISIPDHRVKEYEAQIGKKVQIKCDCSSKTPIFMKIA